MKRILEVKKQIGSLSKNSENPFFKSKYLDLNDLLSAIEPLLHEQGLILSQPIQDSTIFSNIIDAETGTILMSSQLPLPDLKDPQKLGSCITYYRRYTLKSLLSISENDDDANLASKPLPKKKDKLTPDRFDKAVELIVAGDNALVDKLISKFDLDEDQKQQLTIFQCS